MKLNEEEKVTIKKALEDLHTYRIEDICGFELGLTKMESEILRKVKAKEKKKSELYIEFCFKNGKEKSYLIEYENEDVEQLISKIKELEEKVKEETVNSKSQKFFMETYYKSVHIDLKEVQSIEFKGLRKLYEESRKNENNNEWV